jgi:hypothetical protein
MTRERSGRVGAGPCRRRTARAGAWARWRHARASGGSGNEWGLKAQRTKPNPGFCTSNTRDGRSSGSPSSFPVLPSHALHSGVRTKSSGIQQRGLRRHVREHVPCHRLPVSPSSRHAGGHHRVRGAFYLSCAAAPWPGPAQGVFKCGHIKTIGNQGRINL